MKYRPSRLALALACVPSHDDDTQTAGDDAAARLGTAAHAYAADMVRNIAVEPQQYADYHHVNAEDLKHLCWSISRIWEQLRVSFPEPIVEQEITDYGELGISGTPDLRSPDGEILRVLDWKTGYTDAGHDEQARAYAYLSLLEYPGIDTVAVTVVHVREMTIDTQHYTREQLTRWYDGCVERLQEGEGIYRPGKHCGFCPRNTTCQAREASASQAVAVLSSGSFAARIADMTPTELSRVLQDAKHIAGFVEAAKESVHAEVVRRGGSALEADGSGLEIVGELRTEIVAAKAWPILCGHLGTDAVIALAKLPKGEVGDALGAIAPHRGKGKFIKAVLDDLDAAGATAGHAVPKLKQRSPLKPLAQIES